MSLSPSSFSKIPAPSMTGLVPVESQRSLIRAGSFNRIPSMDGALEIMRNLYHVHPGISILTRRGTITVEKGRDARAGSFRCSVPELNIASGELMAVKQLSREEVSSKEISSLENEIKLLQGIRGYLILLDMLGQRSTRPL